MNHQNSKRTSEEDKKWNASGGGGQVELGFDEAEQLCDSTPIVSERTDECAPDRALDPAVLYRLKLFSAMNKLKKVALQVNKANEY
ncbi:calcium-dependent protein kinase [Trifolium repens]|nr:calcium-dependent protein kinase [Trifolium repens]